MEEITKEEFMKYEEIRKSGRCNMADSTMVEKFTGLSRSKIFDIMCEYNELICHITKNNISKGDNASFTSSCPPLEKERCSKCKKIFNVNDLDRELGEWICRECEDIRR